jgi:hypothetical protein
LHYYLYIYPALTDLSFDSIPDAYFFLKPAAAFVVMVAADAIYRSCEEQQRLTNQALYISRKKKVLPADPAVVVTKRSNDTYNEMHWILLCFGKQNNI